MTTSAREEARDAASAVLTALGLTEHCESFDRLCAKIEALILSAEARGIERAASWHAEQAAKLRAMNMPRNVEATGGAMDTIRWDTADEHDGYAAEIRALSKPGDRT